MINIDRRKSHYFLSCFSFFQHHFARFFLEARPSVKKTLPTFYSEIHFGTRVHLHLVCFLIFQILKMLRKNLKKIGHKHTQVSNTRENFRQKITIFLLCAKKTNFRQKLRSKKICFLSEICLFYTKQKNWYFLSKFFTSVRHLRMFVSNFFQIFPKHFQILKN